MPGAHQVDGTHEELQLEGSLNMGHVHVEQECMQPGRNAPEAQGREEGRPERAEAPRLKERQQ